MCYGDVKTMKAKAEKTKIVVTCKERRKNSFGCLSNAFY